MKTLSTTQSQKRRTPAASQGKPKKPATRKRTSRPGNTVPPSDTISIADARPFLKWAGGKWKLMPELEKRLPKSFNNYYEPFMGSGAFFFWMKAHGKFKHGTKLTLVDLNEELVNCFRQVQGNSYLRLLAQLKKHEEKHLADTQSKKLGTKHYYYVVRQTLPKTPIERAARFIYLNRTCFNGLWRVNRAGKFNVPMGRYKNPAICNPAAIKAAHDALKGVTIEAGRYDSIETQVGVGDLVYLDPPYVPLTKTAAFTSYTSSGFGHAEQKQLAELALRLARKGACVLISNSDTAATRILYPQPPFTVDTITARRAIGRNAESRIAVPELVVKVHGRQTEKTN